MVTIEVCFIEVGAGGGVVATVGAGVDTGFGLSGALVLERLVFLTLTDAVALNARLAQILVAENMTSRTPAMHPAIICRRFL